MKLLFLFMSSLFIFLNCNEESKEEVKENNQLFDHEIMNPKIIISNTTSKIIEANAHYLKKNNDDDAILYGDVKTHFFNDKNEHISILTADTAKINENNNNFNAIGNVIVISDSGLTLKTNQLIWDHQYKLVISNDSVEFTTKEKDTLFGVGFESDMDLSHWKILKPSGVTSRILN